MNLRLPALLLISLTTATQASAVEVIGHRGRLQPTQVENSLRQMQLTGATGIGVEMDLRRSRDGTLWVLHDDTLDRSTTGHGAIAERSDVELAQVRLRTPDGHVTDEPLPRFDAVAAWAAKAPKVRLMLDLKGATGTDVLPLLRRYRLASHSILLTFDRTLATDALNNSDGAPVSVLVTKMEDIESYRQLAAGRPLALYVPQRSAPALFEAARVSGLEVVSDALPTPQGESLDALAAREGCATYATFLATHPADVLVSDTPQCVTAGNARH
jgi:glycerophosphoryl diester phosphodiesterase